MLRIAIGIITFLIVEFLFFIFSLNDGEDKNEVQEETNIPLYDAETEDLMKKYDEIDKKHKREEEMKKNNMAIVWFGGKEYECYVTECEIKTHDLDLYRDRDGCLCRSVVRKEHVFKCVEY